MPRTKLSVSDRIVADVLSLPHAEATLLVGYLGATLKQISGVTTPKVVRQPRQPKAAIPSVDVPDPNPAVPAPARKPRIPRAAPAAVPAGDPGASMEVGD